MINIINYSKSPNFLSIFAQTSPMDNVSSKLGENLGVSLITLVQALV
jgi:hypothetical protein